MLYLYSPIFNATTYAHIRGTFVLNHVWCSMSCPPNKPGSIQCQVRAVTGSVTCLITCVITP